MAYNGATVRKASNQTAANYTTQTRITWDSEDEDTNGWHSNVTNPSRLTVPSGVSRVDLEAFIHVSSITANVYIAVKFYKDNALMTNAPRVVRDTPVTDGEIFINAMSIPVTPGNYFEVDMIVETDTSITVETDSYFKITAVQ